MSVEPEGAVFVMPRPASGQTGPVGMWLAVAGWAAASREIWGRCWLVTPEGVLSPEQARAVASRRQQAPAPSWRRFVPRVVKTAAKDVRDWRRAARFAASLDARDWEGHDLAFVWQRHDLFQDAGHRLAQSLSVPLVLSVDAPVVWEARRWGVGRPGWGKLVEKVGEDPLLRAADLLACVSDEVAAEVERRGVAPERILVTPNGVDVRVFTPDASGEEVRKRWGLEEAFVVGWIGSFHRFHGLDLAVEAAAALQEELPSLTLLLVGDGLDRPRIETRARKLGVEVVFTGTVEHGEIPRHIAAMDVALVLGVDDSTFHYSPLKLREYMACGKAVVASRVGELSHFIKDGEDGLLVEAQNVAALSAAIRRLHDQPRLRSALGTKARARMVAEGSWEVQVRRVYEALKGGGRVGR